MGFIPLNRPVVAAAFISVLGLAACAEDTTQMAGQSRTVPMTQEEVLGRTSMIYRAANIDGRKYTRFIIDQVAVYRGTDTSWGGASEQEIQEMAAFLRTEMVRALGDRFPVVTAPGPNVARIKLTLAGLENNAAVLAPVSRLIPIGLVTNIASSAAGKEGSFSGSVTLSGEIVDGQTNQSLVVFAQKRGPDAMDIGSTFSDRDAQKAAITGFADAFRERLDSIQKAGAPR